MIDLDAENARLTSERDDARARRDQALRAVEAEREDAAALRFLWYKHRTTYYRDMKPYGG